MAILDDKTRNEVQNQLKDLKNEVKLIYFDKETPMSVHIKEILDEVSKLNSKIKVEMHDFVKEPEVAKQYDVGDAPVILFKTAAVKGDARYYGIPSGYEFGGFIEILKMISTGAASADQGKYFDALPQETKLEVFVTPTCPHCPTSAYVAIKFAMASAKVHAHVYEAMEFPQVATKYRVMGVPKTVINDGKGEFVGGYPEDVAFMQMKKFLGS